MKSSKVRELFLQMQEEREETKQLQQQMIRDLNLSYKEQVEAQKAMIEDLLQSEQSLKAQLESLQQKYNNLKTQKSSKIESNDTKSNNLYHKSNFNNNSNDLSSNLKLFIPQCDLKNSCILENIEEEEVKINIDDQKQYSGISNSFDINTPKTKIDKSDLKQQQQQLQNFNISSQQNLYQSKIYKNNSQIPQSNDHAYLYKSIQSSNYIINPPVCNSTENKSYANFYNNNNNYEIPETIEKAKQKVQFMNPSQILLQSRNDMQFENTNKPFPPSNISIIVTEPVDSDSKILNPNKGINCTNQIINNTQLLQSQQIQMKKSNQIIPIIDIRKNKENLLASQQFDGLQQQGQFTPNILQSQLLFVSNQQISQPTINSPINQGQINIGDLLFEDFFIIGPSKQEMSDIALNQPQMINGSVQPEIYISFPGQENTTDQNHRMSLKNFCFPHNVEFKKHKVSGLKNGKVDDILNLQIFKANISKNSPNSFVFTMLGDKERNQDRSVLNPILVSSNPQLSMYCVCFTTENFITIPSQENGKKEDQEYVYLSPITYCFMTYYPFISFFLDIISEVANQLKLLRACQYINIFSSVETQQSQQPCEKCNPSRNTSIQSTQNHSSKYELSPIQERISEYSTDQKLSLTNRSSRQSTNSSPLCTCQNAQPNLKKILELDIENEIQNFFSTKFENIRKAISKTQRLVPDYSYELQFKFRQESEFILKNYMVPAYNRITQIEAEWGACLTMSSLSLEDFLFIFTAICLEVRVIFFSQKIALLTGSILTFNSIIKPFTYTMPVIYNVPEVLIDLLDSPVPLILGFNKKIEFMKELEEQGFSFEDKLVVDLDSCSLITQSTQLREFIEKKTPAFKINQQDIADKYFAINPRPSNSLKTFNSLRKKRLSNQNEMIQASSCVNDNLLYESNTFQYNAMTDFITLIGDSMKSYFINHLPPKTEQLVNSFNLNNIKNLIISQNKDDQEFVKEFVKTQIYILYVETLYLCPQ